MGWTSDFLEITGTWHADAFEMICSYLTSGIVQEYQNAKYEEKMQETSFGLSLY